MGLGEGKNVIQEEKLDRVGKMKRGSESGMKKGNN
jgi:hypothetical protein